MNEFGNVNHVEKRRYFSVKREMVLKDPRLGVDIDKVVAERHGVDRKTVCLARKAAGIPPAGDSGGAELRDIILAQPDLGAIPDGHLAKRIGVSPSWLRAVRADAGIPAWQKPSPKAEKVLSHPELGVWTDRAVAEDIGVSEEWVCKVRRAEGLMTSRLFGVISKPICDKEINQLLDGWGR